MHVKKLSLNFFVSMFLFLITNVCICLVSVTVHVLCTVMAPQGGMLLVAPMWCLSSTHIMVIVNSVDDGMKWGRA